MTSILKQLRQLDHLNNSLFYDHVLGSGKKVYDINDEIRKVIKTLINEMEIINVRRLN